MTTPTKNPLPKWLTTTIVGVLILGVASGAAWDGIKTVAPYLGRFLMTLATFGSNALKDAIYRAIPTNDYLHERITPLIFILLILGGAVLLVAYAGRAEDAEEKAREAELKRQLAGKAMLSALLLFLCAAFLGGRTLMDQYSKSAAIYYQRCLATCEPYMTEEEEEVVRAKFAKINNRADYLTIIELLKRTAEKNNDELPAFRIW